MTTENTGIQVGQQVPDFTLTTYDPESGDFGEFNLGENGKAGKWAVVFFYPADFTFVCATEFNALAERYAEFKEAGCEILTVSTDTQFTHLAWQREEKQLADVRYPMGADPTAKLARMFGVLIEEAGLALRGAFLISPEGKLMGSEVNFLNLGRNVDELMRKFKANIFLAENGTDVCPAQWKAEGDKTLKPSAKLVGRVHEALSS
jgi:alkyl hydroperoxide reductase subunit AhpC